MNNTTTPAGLLDEEATTATRSSVESKILELKSALWEIQADQRTEVDARCQAEVEPLIEQAKQLRKSIELELHAKYALAKQSLTDTIVALEGTLNTMRIAESQGVWYAQGTEVRKWERKRFPKPDLYPSKTTGTVAIYDGTQEIAANTAWRERPAMGDIIVLPHKADGGLSKKIERLSDGTELRRYIVEKWFAEGDTPTDNILTRRQAAEGSKQ